jgi:uncharacterized protein (DUF1778 family)
MSQFHSKAVQRNARIDLRVTRAEKELLVQRAADAGISTSDFLVKAALSRPVRSKTAATVINELIKLNLHIRANGVHGNADEIERVLGKIAETVEKVPLRLEDELNSP